MSREETQDGQLANSSTYRVIVCTGIDQSLSAASLHTALESGVCKLGDNHEHG